MVFHSYVCWADVPSLCARGGFVDAHSCHFWEPALHKSVKISFLLFCRNGRAEEEGLALQVALGGLADRHTASDRVD